MYTNLDELDIEASDSSSEDEVPDHVQHLRDVADRHSVSDQSESDDDKFIILERNGSEANVATSATEWTWDLEPEERWKAVASLLSHLCQAVGNVAKLADGYVKQVRRESAEAAAHLFDNARIIGATVVGATRRLRALRAAEPFAAVVEEGCEVMEPNLLAVLAQRSIRKLELVGDHHQLPAFIPSSWFGLTTTIASIKVSLFERLYPKENEEGNLWSYAL